MQATKSWYLNNPNLLLSSTKLQGPEYGVPRKKAATRTQKYFR